MHWIIDEQQQQEEKRYSLEMRLRYRVTQGAKTVWRGNGYTSDLSRTSIRFAASRTIPAGSRVELLIDWPVLFGGMYPMELLVTGTIERSEHNESEVRMISWRFRVAPAARSFEAERAQGWAPRARTREDAEVSVAALA